MEFHIIIDAEKMPPEEQEEFGNQLRVFIYTERWAKYSPTVLGPIHDSWA